jgi:hypothetical protein
MKMIDYDNNLANIIKAIQEIEGAPNIQYRTIFPVKIPRFHTRPAEK